MNKLIIITITSLVLATGAEAAHADRGGLVRFLSAIAQAAEQGRQAHQAQQQRYYEEEYHYADDGYQQVGYYDEGPVIFDIRGDWVMRDGNVNRFQKTHQGYYVAPVGRGRGVHYVEIGENLYQDANSSGTYEVIDDNYMIWTSNDRRNKTIELFRR